VINRKNKNQGGITMKILQGPGVLAVCMGLFFGLSACDQTPEMTPEKPEESSQKTTLANPASVNCIKMGGTLTLEKRGAGGEIGVCYFEDNRQCEEWALLRGNCPKGGLKVTGYDTPAARYCAITGGKYQDPDCTLSDGHVCNATAYYDGLCR